MKFLLDTHIWLWSLLEPEQLSDNTRDVLKDDRNTLFLSPITVWETLILAEKNRIPLVHRFRISSMHIPIPQNRITICATK